MTRPRAEFTAPARSPAEEANTIRRAQLADMPTSYLRDELRRRDGASIGEGPYGQYLIAWNVNGLHWEAELFPDGRVELYYCDHNSGADGEAEVRLSDGFLLRFVEEQGYAVVPLGPIASWQMISARDRLPPGYPPWADDDLPFDGQDTRG